MVLRYTPDEWQKYSESAHALVFEKKKPKEFDRISYALLVVDDKSKKPLAYVTVREHDPDSVYWQFGGSFPEFRKSIYSVRALDEALQYQRKFSKRIVTYVENKNLPMLKMALAFGFIIIGTRAVFGEVYVDFMKEF